MRLVVCPAYAAASLCDREEPSHVVSLVSPGDAVPILPRSFERITLVFNDIAEPQPGLVLAGEADVAALLAFARTWNGEWPLLVHCGAGISRSTAAAFLIACQRTPDRAERAVARNLRYASAHATPNTRLVALADVLLGRSGRMIDAVEELGRGADWVPDPSFGLDLTDAVPA